MPRNKLTLDQVKKVFTEYKHLSGRKISQMYGVSHSTVNHIRSGRTWQHELHWLKVLEPWNFSAEAKDEARSGESAPGEAIPATHPTNTRK